MSYSIFISHESGDYAIADWFSKHVQTIGIKPYLYEHDQKPGTDIANKINSAIRNSDTLVVLLTKHSQQSTYVQQEIGCAEGSNKLVIPIVFPDFNRNELALLQGREYLYFDPEKPQEALQTLLEFLGTKKVEKENAGVVFLALGALLLVSLIPKGK